MNDKILVTYASRAGSTAEIAEALGMALTQNGTQVEVRPMQAVKSLTPYQAILAGSAIRGSNWLPEATQFIQSHRAKLASRPFATFTACTSLAMSDSDQYRQVVTEWVQPVHAIVGSVNEGLFTGKLDFLILPVTFNTLFLRVVVAFGVFPKGDCRNWNAIRVWAESICPLLIQ
jgi:menaquinone-dependent protoporphyrinogen oxidase